MNDYLLPGIRSGPAVIQRLISAIPETEHDVALVQGRFTPREVVAHLADWEPIMRGRIQSAVQSPGSTIEAYDEGQMAIDGGYAQKDVYEQARIFAEERKKTAEYVAGLTREDLQKSATHPERGVLTAEDLAGMLLGHDMYHAEQLSAYLSDRVAATW